MSNAAVSSIVFSLDAVEYHLLKSMFPRNARALRPSYYEGNSKLRALLGSDFLRSVVGKTVIDFGCGEGREALEIAQSGAHRVVGVDIQERLLEIGRQQAATAGIGNCEFTSCPVEKADLILSLDAFEHFESPGDVLLAMARLLKPEGEIVVSFGPTWFHPYGGHTFSVFPWAHLLFTEQALIRWRSDFKNDGAKSFKEVAGGLNQMTIARFSRIVAESPLRLMKLTTVPISPLKWLHCYGTREFTTSIVQAVLKHRSAERQ
jgi:SAM-dependent methyltransferase